MKKLIAIILCLCLLLGCSACGSSYGVKAVQTLVEQQYSLAFRAGDPLATYMIAAIEQLAAEGKVDELSVKWFGERLVSFKKTANAIETTGMPEPRTFIIGVDPNSFPMAYETEGEYWGFDVELATAACEKLGWTLKMQPIEKENVYVELSSGNIDCAWGGIALDPEEARSGLYFQYGPYIDNDIVIATRAGSFVWNKLMLTGKRLTMPSTPEALAALSVDERLNKRLKQISRVAGGTSECFQQLFSGKCDAILTDTTAIYYFNCH